MAKKPQFIFDSEGKYYTITSGNIITGSRIKYLFSFLTSDIYYFALRKFFMGGGIEGEIKINRLLVLPIPIRDKVKDSIVKNLENFVDDIINNSSNISNITHDIKSINKIIANILNLTSEEFDFIMNYKY